MGITKSEIIALIYDAIDEINEEREGVSLLKKSPNTVFLASEGGLDSLGLVSLIVATEERIADVLEIELTIADAKAMSRKNSPFKNVDTLSDYILDLLT